jgi:phosphoribosylformimino-5-aminoimidazole carboxamide ribotide isomerase
MQLFPAIDLLDGRVVRLTRGDYDQVTVYSDDPCAQVRAFKAAGATHLHVVDLDGAREGSLANYDTIQAIAQEGGMYIEVGGGIRTEDRIEQYFELGVDRCILGTMAVRDFSFTERMLQRYGDRIAVGVDARDGFVAINGWQETSRINSLTFCKRLRDAGCISLIYTDISRDGAMQGANLELYGILAQALPEVAITASGGISSEAEIATLKQLGVNAAILGKALYNGTLDLARCIKLAEGRA